jgi:hypothetical protein
MPDGAEAAEEASAALEPAPVAPGQGGAAEPPAYVELSPNGRFGRVRLGACGAPAGAGRRWFGEP